MLVDNSSYGPQVLATGWEALAGELAISLFLASFVLVGLLALSLVFDGIPDLQPLFKKVVEPLVQAAVFGSCLVYQKVLVLDLQQLLVATFVGALFVFAWHAAYRYFNPRSSVEYVHYGEYWYIWG